MIKGNEDIQTLNDAIRVPHRLYTSDGRMIKVRTWSPVVRYDGLVSVDVEGIICESQHVIANEIITERATEIDTTRMGFSATSTPSE